VTTRPVPKRRNDPDLDDYIFMGGRKPKSAECSESGALVATGPLPQRRNDPDLDDYIFMGGRNPKSAEAMASKRSGAAEANRSKSPKER
jgi:hypothetical protein